MPATFIDLTNETLRRLNEVQLTSTNFATATGFHAVVKDAINGAVRTIVQAETEWPFCNVLGTATMVPGTTEYPLPALTRSVDWDTFYQRRDDQLGADAHPLAYVDYDSWHRGMRQNDDNSDQGDCPVYVTRTQRNTFIVSPVPDAAYTVEFEYWSNTPLMVIAEDTCIIPDDYRHVVIDGAMLQAYLFRGNTEAAAIAQKKYETGLKNMRSLLINRYNCVTDTRTSLYLPFGSDF